MQIQRATSKHLDQLAILFDGYRVFYEQPSDLQKARDFIEARIEKNESVIFVVEDEDGELLGFTQLYPLFSSVQARRVWLLNDLYVAKIARRRGVASMLMEAARQFAEETEAKGVALETGTDNHSAQALYDKLGYKRQSGTYWYFLNIDANQQ